MIPSQLEEVCVVPVGEVGGADAACSSEGESEGLIDYRFMCCHAGLAYRYVHDRNDQAEPDQRAVRAHGQSPCMQPIRRSLIPYLSARSPGPAPPEPACCSAVQRGSVACIRGCGARHGPGFRLLPAPAGGGAIMAPPINGEGAHACSWWLQPSEGWI